MNRDAQKLNALSELAVRGTEEFWMTEARNYEKSGGGSGAAALGYAFGIDKGRKALAEIMTPETVIAFAKLAGDTAGLCKEMGREICPIDGCKMRSLCGTYRQLMALLPDPLSR